ncbi:MAG: LON peptidase substrate-binding domain-containing protein, partial [Pygmaiobacter sp.]
MSVKVKVKIDKEHQQMLLPAIALRGLVVFPNNVVHFEVGRPRSIAAVNQAMENGTNLFLVAQKDMDIENPTVKD